MADGNHQVIVSIKDEGPGIDPSIIPVYLQNLRPNQRKAQA